MKILFCNIAYMNHYEGNTERDLPVGAGKWVKENQDAHEKWNFLNYGGICYGFVQNPGQFRIERFDGVISNASVTDGVTIVWCAPKEKDKTVIVGWYENAEVYREYQNCKCTPITGIERSVFCLAKAEDCYLLPEEERIFEIPRASIAGTGKGFGQQNYWYAESEYARTELIPAVLEYMNTHKDCRINRLSSFFKAPYNLSQQLSPKEQDEMQTALDNQDFESLLPLAYRSYEETKSADDAFNVAVSLQEMYQFTEAVKWMEKVIEIEGETWDSVVKLPYWYEQIEEHEKAIEYAQKILEYPQGKEQNIIDEVHCILADNFYWLGDVDEAIKHLDIILNKSTNEDLKAYTRETKREWQEAK